MYSRQYTVQYSCWIDRGSGCSNLNQALVTLIMLQMATQQQQQKTRAGPLVTIGGPTLVAGGGAKSGSGLVSGLATSTRSEPTYTYKVKIVNPAKKSDASVRYLKNC